MKAEEEDEDTKYVIVTKKTQYEFVAKEDEVQYMIWEKEEEKTRTRVSR